MRNEFKKVNVGDLIKGVNNGEIIREAYQRTPSHDLKFSRAIIDSILNNKDIGVITLAECENNKIAILDGSSRLQDIEDFVSNKLAMSKEVVEVFTNTKGETLEKASKLDYYYKDLNETQKTQFNNFNINILIYKETTLEERVEKFRNLNTSTALSNVQKSKGLSNVVVDELEAYLKSKAFITKLFTTRQIQKDELYSVASLIIANLTNNYSSSYTKLVENIKGVKQDELHVEQVYDIIDRIDGAIIEGAIDCSFNKYNIIHLIISLYNHYDIIEQVELNNSLFPAIATQGANSGAKNTERQELVEKALNKQLKKTKKAPVVTEIKELNVDEFIAQ